MSNKTRGRRSRDAPGRARAVTAATREGMRTRTAGSAALMVTGTAFETLCATDYRPMGACPEVQACVNVYADMVASMTVHLMRNTDAGDVRVRNGLSRVIDITPNRWQTHQAFFSTLVRGLLLHGNQVTLPVYRGEFLEELIPLPPSQVSFAPAADGYRILWQGMALRPDEALHFVLNPDPEQPWRGQGYSVGLRDAVRALRQTNATKDALMRSPTPPLIVRVDGLNEQLQRPEGREMLAAQYVDQTRDGRPWFIPAETFEVTTAKPLTLNDLAIKTSLELDKRTVAAIMGVPPYTVGIGDFHREEHNNFVATRLMVIAQIIQQEMTRKLLWSDDLYWRFNNRSLLNYDIDKLVAAGSEMVDRMALRRNEWRDWIGLPPDADMDELLALENYVPADRLGDQAKLRGGGDAT